MVERAARCKDDSSILSPGCSNDQRGVVSRPTKFDPFLARLKQLSGACAQNFRGGEIQWPLSQRSTLLVSNVGFSPERVGPPSSVTMDSMESKRIEKRIK